jgi:hypothetical protein
MRTFYYKLSNKGVRHGKEKSRKKTKTQVLIAWALFGRCLHDLAL